MRIFNLPRAGGKTMRMLYASEFQRIPILCRNQAYKAGLMYKAEFLGIDIPEPITVHDLMCESEGKDFRGVLVDEALTVLREIIRQVTHGRVSEVIGIAFSDEANEHKIQRL